MWVTVNPSVHTLLKMSVSHSVPRIPWAFAMAEACGLILCYMFLLILLLHKHRYSCPHLQSAANILFCHRVQTDSSALCLPLLQVHSPQAPVLTDGNCVSAPLLHHVCHLALRAWAASEVCQ